MKQITKFFIFAALVYFVQSTGSVGGLASNTVQFFCKEGLAWTPEKLAYFLALISAAWFVKPVIGLISDFFPICGYRRKSYIIIANLFAIGLWWILAVLSWSGLLISFWWLAVPMIFIGLCFAVTDIATDGLTVAKGNDNDCAGDLQSVQWSAIYIGLLLTTVLSVWLAEYALPDTIVKQYFNNEMGIGVMNVAPIDVAHSVMNRVGIVFIITSIFPMINLFSVLTLVEEEKTCVSRDQIKETWQGLKKALSQKPVWILALCIFGLHFSPGFNAPLFYYIRDHLGPDGGQMPKMWFAWLSMLDMGVAIVGILFFKRFYKRLNLRKWLYITAILGGIATFLYLFIDSVSDLILIAVCFGSIGGFLHVAFLTIAAKNTPPMVEAVIFAGYCSIFNIARSASNAAGGYLWGVFTAHSFGLTINPEMGALQILLILSGIFTLCTIPLIALMKLDGEGKMEW